MPQRKIFVATRILVFDFELFISERRQMGKVDSILVYQSATLQITVHEVCSKRVIITTCLFNPAVQNADHTMRPASNRLIMSNEDDSPAFSM